MGSEVTWRLGAFLGGLVLLSLWEAMMPRRKREIPRKIRWTRNLGLIGINNVSIAAVNNVLSRILAPITAAGAALWAEQAGFGLFHWLNLPHFIAVIAAVVILDLVIYGQHILFHWSPTLWRLHMVHHADQELDVTSGIRFHTLEIFISIFIKVVAVVLLGAPFIGVVIFEIVLNLSAMFNHGNIKLPIPVDRFVRKFIVTPDMHRVHHSVLPNEHHSNFGFNLSIWDRIFRTYTDQPRDGHEGMTIGLNEFQDVDRTNLGWMLRAPFMKKGEK